MKNEDYPPQPDLTICPKHFCFFWNEEGDYVAKGLHKNVEEAMGKMIRVTRNHCGFSYGQCVRNEDLRGDKDYYEPCEPRLEKAGLPDFYFNNPEWHKLPEKRRLYNDYFGIEEDISSCP